MTSPMLLGRLVMYPSDEMPTHLEPYNEDEREDEDNIHQLTLGLTVADVSYIYWGLMALEDGNNPLFQNKEVLRSIKQLRGYIDMEFNDVLDIEREQAFLEKYNPSES